MFLDARVHHTPCAHNAKKTTLHANLGSLSSAPGEAEVAVYNVLPGDHRRELLQCPPRRLASVCEVERSVCETETETETEKNNEQGLGEAGRREGATWQDRATTKRNLMPRISSTLRGRSTALVLAVPQNVHLVSWPASVQ